MRRIGQWLRIGVVALVMVCTAVAGTQPAPSPSPEHRRSEEQTFLTFPEWFLVYSSADYAAVLRNHPPSEFPWWGHIGQFWSSYAKVVGATREYPFNAEYHLMIQVIGVSTTIEYALRSAYETLLGRLAELGAPAAGTAEDRYAAWVAQAYVDFIRVRPWYEFDFVAALRGLWRDTPAFGDGMLRKWERRYALTTEYGVKALYAWLVGLGTQSAFGSASSQTVVELDAEPPAGWPGLTTVGVRPDGRWLGTLPRYDAFKDHALSLAMAGREFREIAGNGPQAPLVVSAIAPIGWEPDQSARLMFVQPLATRRDLARAVLVTQVGELSALLRKMHAAGVQVEHVYDY